MHLASFLSQSSPMNFTEEPNGWGLCRIEVEYRQAAAQQFMVFKMMSP